MIYTLQDKAIEVENLPKRDFEYWRTIAIISAILTSMSMWIMIYFVKVEGWTWPSTENLVQLSSFFMGAMFSSIAILAWGEKNQSLFKVLKWSTCILFLLGFLTFFGMCMQP